MPLRSVVCTIPSMKLSVISALLTASAASAFNPAFLPGNRSVSLLHSIPGLPRLPTLDELLQRRQTAALNLNDIQSDIIVGQQKIQELFYFFAIADVPTFKQKLSSTIAPIITSAQQMLSVTTQPLAAVNIAFSQSGLTALGVTDNMSSSEFASGMFSGNIVLGDVSADWEPVFKGTEIHGVFIVASDTSANVDAQVGKLESALGSSINKLYTLQGNSRPGDQAGHEAFGYLDGIGQPAISGFATPIPGQGVVQPCVILAGLDGDIQQTARPAWSVGGSFLAFRQLEQKVPEYNKFLLDNAPPAAGLTVQQRADRFGARLFGRWKSGVPVDLFPDADNPAAVTNTSLVNDFDFTHAGFDFATDQTHCPFAAHIRHMRPRADASNFNPAGNAIMRAGIPYGPEVTPAEASSNTSSLARGFAFVAYQSNLNKGFVELQSGWANQINAFSKALSPGFDAIIGQHILGGARWVTGMDPTNPALNISLPFQFVVARGGEYFFAPPISALSGRLAM
ncbi:fungal peroxidase [Exidia glandulosa HHB12029]|uniref:Fungal peroxidase n=1 Tax=Exidia glandulosa HHB12029 TaxID=1314781 RepID=A0A165FHP4_EXIGL|nr:fungal peroxidase [Exidia glandulosa HHB12029]